MNFRPPTGGMKTLLAFSEAEVRTLRCTMLRAIALARQGAERGGGCSGAVIVDPITTQIHAESWDESNSFPFCAPETPPTLAAVEGEDGWTDVGGGGGGMEGDKEKQTDE